MELNLTGKNALVGGASAGIGKATAHELARMGASLTLLARSEEKLKRVRDELHQRGKQRHHYCVVDYEDSVVLESKVSEHLRQHGPVHHPVLLTSPKRKRTSAPFASTLL
jgi:3-oxoacyl-[acyl-carrier protein] reductase